ncbi:MAG: NAD(P)/FAD-dependent oxidoreductase [Chlamydiales bacterium]|nr:NAD(P)/FAD-dependent oxidoreductase [Chlamydiales bacterium]
MDFTLNNTSDRPIVIIGAGVSGLVLSILLKKLQKNILIIEKRPPFQSNKLEDPRSFNMTISERGMKCFRKIGVEKRILECAVPIKNRIIHLPISHSISQNRIVQSYGKEKEDIIFSIKRSDLIRILYEESSKNKNTKMIFDSELVDVNKNGSSLTVRSRLTNQELIMPFSLLIGADGGYSKTREFVLSGQLIDFQVKYFKWIYKKFSFSSVDARMLKIDPCSLHIFPQHNSTIFAIPNQDQSFSSIYCCDINGLSDIRSSEAHKYVESKFIEDFPQLFDLSNTIRGTLNDSKIGGLLNVHLSKWSCEDKIILIGDAAHAVFPFYGQGMNAALQDCQVLASLLVSEKNNFEALSKYETIQKTSVSALSDLCASHFYYLSQKSLSPICEAQRLIDNILKKLKIFTWHSEYNLVAQTEIPYNKISEIIRKQNTIRKLLGIVLFDYFFGLFIFFKRKVSNLFVKSKKTIQLRLNI